MNPTKTLLAALAGVVLSGMSDAAVLPTVTTGPTFIDVVNNQLPQQFTDVVDFTVDGVWSQGQISGSFSQELGNLDVFLDRWENDAWVNQTFWAFIVFDQTGFGEVPTLSPGKFRFRIAPLEGALAGGSYHINYNFVASPVPEAPTVALFLIGIAAVRWRLGKFTSGPGAA